MTHTLSLKQYIHIKDEVLLSGIDFGLGIYIPEY